MKFRKVYGMLSFNAFPLVNSLYCTDYSEPEDPEAEVSIQGKTTAYAELGSAYAQVNGIRGSVNESESYVYGNKARFVCEWITTTGNGTFRSICLSNSSAKYYYESEFVAEINTASSGDDYVMGLTSNKDYIFVKVRDVLYKIACYFNVVFQKKIDNSSNFVNNITCSNNKLYGHYYFDRKAYLAEIDIDNFEINILKEIYGLQAVAITNEYFMIRHYDNTNKLSLLNDSLGIIKTYKDTTISTNEIYSVNNKIYKVYNNVYYELIFSETGVNTETKSIARYPIFFKDQFYYFVYSENKKFNIYKTDLLFPHNLFSRVRLSEAVTKNDTQTMKITYDLNW